MSIKYDYYFETAEEATDILDEMRMITSMYGRASVGDFKDLVDVSSDYQDYNYIWSHRDLSKACVIKYRAGYKIMLPAPVHKESKYVKDTPHPSTRYATKILNITIDTDVNDDIRDRLRGVLESLDVVSDRDVFITIM